MLARNARSTTGRCARVVKDRLASFGQASSAFAAAGFSPGDAAVIEAGEAAGRLDMVFAELEAYYRQLAEARLRIVSRSIYPLVILHLGAILLAIPPAIIEGGLRTFLFRALPLILGFYVILVLLWIAWKVIRRSLVGSAASARGLMAVPVLGGFLTDWTAWKFSSVLSLYVRAGGGMLKGFEIAGASSENALLHALSRKTVDDVRTGTGLAESIRRQPGWPGVLERALEVGEHSGRMDEESFRASEIYKERTLGKLDAFSHWSPKILYIIIVLLMGWQAISMTIEVMSSIGSALDGN